MKVILNLTDEQYKHLNEITSVHDEKNEDLLMRLFYDFVYNPSKTIGEETLKDNRRELEEFGELLKEYLHESIEDIHISSKSDEAYETDKAMVHVYRRLLHNHVFKSYVISDLYQVFKNNM